MRHSRGPIASAWVAAFLVLNAGQSGQSAQPQVIGEVTGYNGAQVRTYRADGSVTGQRISTANLPRGRVLVRAPNGGAFGVITPNGIVYLRGIDVSYRLDASIVCDPIPSGSTSSGAIAATSAGAGSVRDCEARP